MMHHSLNFPIVKEEFGHYYVYETHIYVINHEMQIDCAQRICLILWGKVLLFPLANIFVAPECNSISDRERDQ